MPAAPSSTSEAFLRRRFAELRRRGLRGTKVLDRVLDGAGGMGGAAGVGRGVVQTGPVNTMSKMLETWGDAQVVIRLEFVNGLSLEGLVKEVDRDEVVVEPVYEDGSVGPLTVVNLNHVVMAFYDDNPPEVREDNEVEDGEAGEGEASPPA